MSTIERVWPLFADDWGVAYFAKGPRGVTGGYATSPPQLERIAYNLNEVGDYNLYVHLNPSHHFGIKGTSADVVEWRHVLIDIDPYVPGEGNPYEVARHIMHRFPKCCTCIYTGNGIHVYLSLEPTSSTALVAGNRKGVERATGRFLNHLNSSYSTTTDRIDTATSDLSRIVRLPGTINKRTAVRSRIIQLGAQRNTANWFGITPTYYSESPLTEPKQVPVVETWNRIELLKHLNETASTFVFEGATHPRRPKAFAAAKNMQELGVPIEIARKWMIYGASICDPPLLPSQIEPQLKSAYRSN